MDELKQKIQEESEQMNDMLDEAKSKAVSEKKVDPEAEMPGKDLFERITQCIVSVMLDDNVKNAFTRMRNKFVAISKGDASVVNDLSKDFVEIMSTSITYSVFTSIGMYDNDLKDALQNSFDDISSVIRSLESRIMTLEMINEDRKESVKK